jgi:hypothetical protein
VAERARYPGIELPLTVGRYGKHINRASHAPAPGEVTQTRFRHDASSWPWTRCRGASLRVVYIPKKSVGMYAPPAVCGGTGMQDD